MEQRNLGLWLVRRFTPDQWDRGVSKDDLIEAAEEDDDLVRRFMRYPEGGLYRSPDDVLQGTPHRGWEDDNLAGPLDGDDAEGYHPRDPTSPPPLGFNPGSDAEDQRG